MASLYNQSVQLVWRYARVQLSTYKSRLIGTYLFINFTSEEIKSFTPDQNVHTEIENMQDENFNTVIKVRIVFGLSKKLRSCV